MFNVESTSADTSCYHDISDPILKVLDSKFSILLILTSMKNEGFVADLKKLFEKFISFNLLINEYQNATFVIEFAKNFH